MTTCKLLTKTEFLQAFPESPASIVGEPTMKELIKVLRHLIDSSQYHQSEANNGLNLLHICLPEDLHCAFITDPTVQAYLQWATDPGPGPVYTPNQDVAMWENEKLAWERLKKIYVEDKNMDAALLDSFLQLISTNYKDNFNLIKNRNPNMSFMDCFKWLFTTYVHADEADHEENKATMSM